MPTIAEQMNDTDDKLFSSILGKHHHVLQQFLADNPDTVYNLGIISITRYHDINCGLIDLAIIAAPRDRTISCMNARLTRALVAGTNRIHGNSYTNAHMA